MAATVINFRQCTSTTPLKGASSRGVSWADNDDTERKVGRNRIFGKDAWRQEEVEETVDLQGQNSFLERLSKTEGIAKAIEDGQIVASGLEFEENENRNEHVTWLVEKVKTFYFDCFCFGLIGIFLGFTGLFLLTGFLTGSLTFSS